MKRQELNPAEAWRIMSAAEWGVLSTADRDQVLSENAIQTHSAGTDIFSQGQPCGGIYFVLSGTIAIHIESDNRSRTLLRLADTGTTLGLDSYFSGHQHRNSAVALTQVTICFVGRTVLDKLIERTPSLLHNFLATTSTALNMSDVVLAQTIHLNVRARLAIFLLRLRDRHGQVDDDGNLLITIPMSRRNMASAIGTRPESLSRAIRALQDSGKATFRGKLVTVSDLDDLLDEAEAS